MNPAPTTLHAYHNFQPQYGSPGEHSASYGMNNFATGSGSSIVQGNLHINSVTYQHEGANSASLDYPRRKHARGDDDYGNGYDDEPDSATSQASPPVYTAPPPATSSNNITADVVTALTEQFNLDANGRAVLLSFYRAAARLPDPADSMTRLLMFAQQTQVAQLLLKVSENVVLTETKVTTLTANKKFEITEDLEAHISLLAKRVLVEDDREKYREMWNDVLKKLTEDADRLNIKTALSTGAPKKKITSVIKTRSNTVREGLRRMIITSILKDSPAAQTLSRFCYAVMDKHGQGLTSAPKQSFIARCAQMRDYALGMSAGKVESEIMVLDDSNELDEPAVAPSTSTRGRKKGPGSRAPSDDDTVEGKFWLGFEKYLREVAAQFRGNKDGFNRHIHALIEEDNRLFDPVSGPSSSTAPATTTGTSGSLNNFMSTIFN